MKKYQISEEQAQQILNYLTTCSYQQVYQLVQILLSLEEIKEKNNYSNDYGTAEEPGVI